MTCLLAGSAGAGTLGDGEASVTGLTPKQAMVGQLVTISGINLDGTTSVTFGSVVSHSARVDPNGDWVRAVVPSGVQPGSVYVTLDNSGNPVSAGPLQILAGSVPAAANPQPPTAKKGGVVAPVTRVPPRIESFSPTAGRVGTKVRITGANLGGATWLKFAGVRAQMTMSSQSAIIVLVPKNAHSGKIAVHTAGGTGVSVGRFVVLKARSV
jgi:IPT/TIG domain-containing protein